MGKSYRELASKGLKERKGKVVRNLDYRQLKETYKGGGYYHRKTFWEKNGR